MTRVNKVNFVMLDLIKTTSLPFGGSVKLIETSFIHQF